MKRRDELALSRHLISSNDFGNSRSLAKILTDILTSICRFSLTTLPVQAGFEGTFVLARTDNCESKKFEISASHVEFTSQGQCVS